jgi:DNA-binding response OmpR family regulator
MHKILLIDDEKIYADPLIIAAKSEHLDIHWESTGMGGIRYLSNNHENIDLLLLDMVLPDINGRDVQKKISHQFPQIPIIIITTRKLTEIDEIVGLELGAIDYFDKNKSLNILILKIKTIFEKQNINLERTKDKVTQTLSYNKDTEQFSFAKNTLNLKGKEHNILLILYNNKNRVLSDVRLIQESGLSPTAEVKGYIAKIRKSLKASGADDPQSIIRTEVMRGYRYKP